MSKVFCILINVKLIKRFLIWVLCIAIHKYVSNLVYVKGTAIKLDDVKPLYDLLQKNILNFQPYRVIPEFLHLIPIIYLFYMIITNLNNNSVAALLKLLKVHGQLMILRCICFSVTLLPDSSEMCKVTKHIGSCYDLIFSGHSTAMFLTTYILHDYFKIRKNIYTILQLNNLLTSFLIVICRNHYTIDIIVSFLATNYLYFRHNTEPSLTQYYKNV
jgi:hypothetical protein